MFSSLVPYGLLIASGVLPTSTSPVVDLGYAAYKGFSDATLGTNNFYGIRYAAPPTGDLRWRAPVPIEKTSLLPHNHTLDATSHGPQCPQFFPAWQKSGPTYNPYAGDEDCLYLNVIAPSTPRSTRLPVIVQIHGGGYVKGTPQTIAPGNIIVSESDGGVIYVGIQYRLNVFGFLSGSDIKDSGTANAAILDQREAIEWVQRNIAAFGGDPGQVTLFGASAGGGSVLSQLTLYGGEINPPFRAAIMEYPYMQPMHSDTTLEAQYRSILVAANCSSLKCLRSLSWTALFDATMTASRADYQNGLYGFGDFYYGPSVDGFLIQDLPTTQMKRGHFSKVPLLTDRDQFEGIIFTNTSIRTESELPGVIKVLWKPASTAFLLRLFELYPSAAFDSSFFRRNDYFSLPGWLNMTAAVPSLKNNTAFAKLQEIFGDGVVNCPTYTHASAVITAGMPVWKLVYNAGSGLHGATIPPLFSYPGSLVAGVSDNATLATYLKQYVINFVIALDPNGASSNGTRLPYWPPYAAQNLSVDTESMGFQVLEVNRTTISATRDPDASNRCDFLSSHNEILRN